MVPILFNTFSDIKSLFPTITVLDQSPVVEEITFDLGDNFGGQALPPLSGSFFDAPMTSATLGDFCQK